MKSQLVSELMWLLWINLNDVLTLTETETDKIATVPNSISQGGHILAKMKFPVSPELQKFSLCYFYVKTNN